MISRCALRTLSVGLVVCMLVGCGVSTNDLDEAESRIEALQTKGVPDSVISAARVHLYNARTAKKLGNSLKLKRNADSLLTALDRAEASFSGDVSALRPLVDSLRSTFDERMEGLTGLHEKQADSIAAIVDSFVNKDWILQAKEKTVLLDTLLPKLHEQEEKAKEFARVLVGSWAGERVPSGSKYKAVERKEFLFKRDGSAYMTEQMKGQTAEDLKEDWKFESWGTWRLKGDTAFLHITREKCSRQNYWIKKDGRWVKDVKPTYDSTITDSSKDRFMTWEYMKEELRKF